MSYLSELDSSGFEQRNTEDLLSERAPEEHAPGFFSGVLKAPALGFMRGLTKLNDFGLTATDLIYPMSDEERDQQAGIKRKLTDYFTPDAHTVGTAGRVLGGVAEGVAPLVVPGAGPALMVGSNTLAAGKEAVDAGVDSTTAGGMAAIEGAANIAGLKLPILGGTLTKRLLTGAAGNVTLGALSTEAENKLLDARGYNELAQNYNPADIEARATDVISGLVFGGLHHLTLPSERDAVGTLNNAKHFQQDTAPGIPADPVASAAHVRAMETATEQTLRGEPVNVDPEVTRANFESRPPREVPIPQELRELDANRAEKTPEVSVELDDNGRAVTVRTPGGFTEARVKGGEFLQISNTETVKAARGRGEGTARMEQLLKIAEERGLTLASDTKVSPQAARFYERLARDGFTVIRNAARADGEGHLVSEDSRPIFEVHPKDAGIVAPVDKQQNSPEFDPNYVPTKTWQQLAKELPQVPGIRAMAGLPAQSEPSGEASENSQPQSSEGER